MLKRLFLILIIVTLAGCTSPVERVAKLTVKSHLNKKIIPLANSCYKIMNWEKRDYSFNWNPYLKMQEGYRITRLGDSYEVYLKIVTRSPEPNANNTYEYKKLPKAIVKKWRGCLSQVNESITSNGSKIRFHLVDYNLKHDMPFAVLMNQKTDIEKNDHLWLHKTSCAEMIKLSFHLVGLNDETPSKKYTCRPKSASDSPLNDINEALYNIKRQGFEYVTYRCGCDSYQNRNCASLMSKGYQSWGKDGNFTCPTGSYLIKKYTLKKDMWDWAQKNKAAVLNYYKRPFGELGMDLLCQAYGAIADNFSHCEISKTKSLIKPAQFQAILYPKCTKKNALYEKCSLNAYETKSQGCSYQKAVCYDDKASWLQL